MEDNSYRERLANDLASWTRDELITPAQERALLARIGAGEPRMIGALRLGWLVTAVSIIGAIILAAGIGTFFASNWQSIPDVARLAVLLAAIAASYAGAWFVAYRLGMSRVGGALFLLGALLYEASLFLVADTFRIPIAPPLLLLAVIGIAPLAYALGSRILLLIAIGDLVGYTVWQLVDYYGDTTTSQATLIVVGALGVALYAVGRLHELRAATRRFADVYVLAGVLTTLGLVYIFGYQESWEALIDNGVTSYAAPAIVYVALALAAALVAAQWRQRAPDIERDIEAAGLLAMLALAAVVATWPAWTGYAVLFNVVYFAAAAGIAVHGFLRGDSRYVDAGLVLIGLGVLSRYVDVFWPVLARSAFFIIGGVVLLVLSFMLERFRRAALREQAPALPVAGPSGMQEGTA
jgi:uncharacterized membrane protein